MATKANWTAPAVPQLENLDALETLTAIPRTGTYEGVRVEDGDFAGSVVSRFTCLQGEFSRVNFAKAKWSGVKLTDVVFNSCVLANAQWPAARFLRVEVRGSKLVGIDLEKSEFIDTAFRDCTLELANLTAATFRNCLFENCNLACAAFDEADLRGTPFVNCVLREASLQQAKLADVNFRGSEIGKLRVDANDLRGAIFDPSQAAQLAYELLGIRAQ